jgi:Fe-S cluster assembly protein SufD
VSHAKALESYRALPLPDTTEEHWRFTDLKDFDPDSFGQVSGSDPQTGQGETMLELDVAGLATISESGVEIERAPAGVTFEALTQEHEKLYSLVGWEEKFAAHNAAVWEHGLLVVVPKGVQLDKPLYVRVTNSTESASLFWRLLVVAEEGADFTLVEEVASTTDDLRSYTNTAQEFFLEQGSKFEFVSIQNLSRETWHFATHHARVERNAELDWVAGGFGSKKGKVRIQNDLAGEGAASRVTGAYFTDGDQHLDYDTFQEHIAPNTTSDFAFKGALRDRSTAVWRRRTRRRRTRTRRTATSCSLRRLTPSRFRASRSSRTTSAAPTGQP